MAIVGVESVVFAVDDLDLCTRFWDDFGLVPVVRTLAECAFEVPSGSRVICRRRDDPQLPSLRPNWHDVPGIRETVWGLDTAEALEALVADDGTGHIGYYLPNAPFADGSLDVDVNHLGPWSAGLALRYLGAFLLTADDHVQGHGYHE